MISHYSSFGEAIQANSAIGLVESEKAGDRATEYHPTIHIPRYEEIPEQIGFETVPADEIAAVSAPRYRNRRIAVVVPAYNEELLIGETLYSIPAFVEKIYVVDDCSEDRTLSIIQEYAKKDPRIVPIRHTENGGVGASIVTGYRAALADGIEIAAVMAGDNQMDPVFLPKLLDPIIDGKCEFTKGNRLKPGFWKGMSNFRLVGNIILTILNKLASGYWDIKDPQNGYVALSIGSIKKIDLESLFPRFAFENDLMIKANIANIKMRNVDIPAKYGFEKSKIKYSEFIYSTSIFLLKSFLFRIWNKSKQSMNPVYLLYISSLILLVIGIPLAIFYTGIIFIFGLILFVISCVSEAFQQKNSLTVKT